MADVELQEQTVPLKNAEQGATEGAESAAGGESQQPAEGAAAEPKAKEKKGWFSKKKNTKTEVVTVTSTTAAEPGSDGEGGGANNVNEKQKSSKKCPFMFCRPQKCAAEGQQSSENQQQQQENQPSFQYNMVQRDDRKLQEAIDLGVDQIFGEPDAVHSLNGIWKTTNSVFVAVRNFFYKLLSLIFAIPLAIVFGILFAVVSMLSVYVFVPIGRLLSIPFGWVAKVFSVVVTAILDPICHSCGLIFSNVKVSRYGINQDPTAVMTA